jgi:hypothetical protein
VTTTSRRLDQYGRRLLDLANAITPSSSMKQRQRTQERVPTMRKTSKKMELMMDFMSMTISLTKLIFQCIFNINI